MSKKTETVHLTPTLDFHIPGVPAIEQDVTPERAAELLAYRPPAFTTDSPVVPAAPSTDPSTPDGPPDSSPEEE